MKTRTSSKHASVRFKTKKKLKPPPPGTVRRAYEFDEKLILRVRDYALKHSTSLNPLTIAMVMDKALRLFLAQFDDPHSNGTGSNN